MQNLYIQRGTTKKYGCIIWMMRVDILYRLDKAVTL